MGVKASTHTSLIYMIAKIKCQGVGLEREELVPLFGAVPSV